MYRPSLAVLNATLLLFLAHVLGAQAPAELAALETQAEQRYAEDDLDGAIELYRELGERHPEPRERARVLMAAAWLEHYSGRWETAQDTMYRALSLDPEYPFEAEFYSQDFVAIYNLNLKRVDADRERGASEREHDAIAAMQRGETETARALLEEALELRPESPTALYNRALIELQSGRSDAAIDGFQRVLSLAEEVPLELRAQTLNNLGLLFYEKAFYDDAVEALKSSLDIDSKNGRAWTNLGLSHRRLGRQAEAVEALARARELRPEDAATLNNLALAYLDNRNWDEAKALLGAATRQRPGNPRLWLNLGLAQRGSGELDEASESFNRVLELDDENLRGDAATASTHLALTRYEAKDYIGAMAAARRTLEWLPDRVEPWIYLGLAQYATSDFRAAIESLSRALELDPSRAETANNLGNAHFAAGDFEAAKASFERALSLRSDFTTARDNLLLAEARLAGQARAEDPAPPAAKRPPPRAKKSSRSRARPTPTPQPSKKSSDSGAGPQGARSKVGLELVDDRHRASGLKAARVTRVDSGGWGASSGLHEGDLIVRAGSRTIESAAQLKRNLAALQSGASLAIDLVRGEEILRLTFAVP